LGSGSPFLAASSADAGITNSSRYSFKSARSTIVYISALSKSGGKATLSPPARTETVIANAAVAARIAVANDLRAIMVSPCLVRVCSCTDCRENALLDGNGGLRCIYRPFPALFHRCREKKATAWPMPGLGEDQQHGCTAIAIGRKLRAAAAAQAPLQPRSSAPRHGGAG